jgi:large subunit ribosomal protein L23
MKIIVTEKAVMMIELKNVLTFEFDMNLTKDQIKKEIEEVFNVKVERLRTLNRQNKKYAYIKLKKNFPAIDVATKLGIM